MNSSNPAVEFRTLMRRHTLPISDLTGIDDRSIRGGTLSRIKETLSNDERPHANDVNNAPPICPAAIPSLMHLKSFPTRWRQSQEIRTASQHKHDERFHNL